MRGLAQALARQIMEGGWAHIPRCGVQRELLEAARSELGRVEAEMVPGRTPSGDPEYRGDRIVTITADRCEGPQGVPGLCRLSQEVEDFVLWVGASLRRRAS